MIDVCEVEIISSRILSNTSSIALGPGMPIVKTGEDNLPTYLHLVYTEAFALNFIPRGQKKTIMDALERTTCGKV